MTHGIYPADFAAMLVKHAGEKYRPSNGTEGQIFIESFCAKCARDKSLREGEPIEECDDDEVCDIVSRTMAFKIEEEDYPSEWQYGKNGQPCCTPFVEFGQPIPERCQFTVDMFESAKP
jgi:hypothetical protein